MAMGVGDGAGPDEGVRIPSELMRSLKRSSSSLLIKGTAGTGKTTLAISVIRALGLKSDFLYLTTRASVSQIINDHSWAKDWLSGPDQTKEKGPQDPYLSPLFVDARLDEPAQLFEKITNQLMDARSPLIVVDAWDSLRELAPSEPLEADMRVLLAWCERANSRLIVTSEDPKAVSLDPLVGGVVVLDQKNRTEGRVRELLIPKLRGIEVRNQSYVFSLEGGIFRSFEPYRPEEFASASYSARRRRPKTASGRCSTGFRELDELLDGGFRAGALVGVELSLAVDPRIVLYLLGNVVAGFALSNRPVAIESIDGMEPEFVDDFLKRLVPRTKLKYVNQEDTARVEDARAAHPIAHAHNPSHLKGQRDAEGPKLRIMGSRALERERGNMRLNLEGLANTLRKEAGLGFVILRPNEKRVSDYLFANSALRMRVMLVKGTLLLQPDVRLPKLLAFDVSPGTGTPVLDLRPIE